MLWLSRWTLMDRVASNFSWVLWIKEIVSYSHVRAVKLQLYGIAFVCAMRIVIS
jgi:hypothetical protein